MIPDLIGGKNYRDGETHKEIFPLNEREFREFLLNRLKAARRR